MAGRRKDKLTAFNRAAILETAHDLFSKNGIEGTTMDEIAKVAGYSKTTIYAYFKSKDDILNHITLEGSGILQKKLQARAQADDSFADFFLGVCEDTAALYESHPVYFRGVAGNVRAASLDLTEDEVQKEIHAILKKNRALTEERLKKAIDAGEYAETSDLPKTALVLWFCLLGIIEKSAQQEAMLALWTDGMPEKEFRSYGFRSLLKILPQREA